LNQLESESLTDSGLVLDLSWHATLEHRVGLQYDRISERITGEFNDFIGTISEPLAHSIDWWVEPPSSRNQLASRMFHACVSVELVRFYLHANERIRSIIVDSAATKKIIQTIADEAQTRVPIRYADSRLQRAIKYTRQILSPLRSLVHIAVENWITKSSGKKTKVDFDQPLVLIDTFVLPGYVEKDRYYPGLWAMLSSDAKKHVRFVPQFFEFKFWPLMKAVKAIRANEEKYLLKEDFTKFTDLLWCIAHWYRIRRAKLPKCSFMNIDLTSLVAEEIRSSLGYRCAVRGLLNYCFAKRMSEAGIKLRTVIDWFENTAMDRGWNAGFRMYYPDAPVAGYQGFHAAFLGAKPTTYEFDAGVVPKTVTVMGQAFQDDLKRYCADIPVEVGPAFRFDWVWCDPVDSDRCSDDKQSILIALPYDLPTAKFMLLMIHEVSDAFPNTRFLVKMHPARKDVLGPVHAAGNIEPISGDLKECLRHAGVVITGGMSTVGFETLSQGIPVISIAMPGKRYEASRLAGIPDSVWPICQDAHSLRQALANSRLFDKQSSQSIVKLGHEMRARLFEPVTREGVDRFLGV
jgi:hypothetical protein